MFHDVTSGAQADYDTAVRELELAQASLDANPTDPDLIAARDAKQAAVDSAANTLTNAQAVDAQEVTKGLTRIRQILESPRVELKLPITATVPKFGERLSWTDASQGQPVDVWMRTRALTWDFDQEQLVIEGEGGIS